MTKLGEGDEGTRMYLAGLERAVGQRGRSSDQPHRRRNHVLMPGTVFKRELGVGQRLCEPPARRSAPGDLFPVDGRICHMYNYQKAWEHLALLDGWLEKVMYESGGQLHVNDVCRPRNNLTADTYVAIDDACGGAACTSAASSNGPATWPRRSSG